MTLFRATADTLIEQALRARGVSAIRAARSANLNRDAIRAVLRGRSPSFERVAEICEALGMDFHIGLRPETVRSDKGLAEEADHQVPEEADQELPNAPDAEIPPVPLTRFTSRMRLPVRDLVACSPQGHLSQAHDADRAPAPVDLPDSHAFYLRMPGHSMVPAGIWPGDFCLVSPCARLENASASVVSKSGGSGDRSGGWFGSPTDATSSLAGTRLTRRAIRRWWPSSGCARTSSTEAWCWPCIAAGHRWRGRRSVPPIGGPSRPSPYHLGRTIVARSRAHVSSAARFSASYVCRS